ncbi:MAG: YbaN family protein [Odoribacter sp.]|nr:YbaN family protein [Odoribacter sp.]
MRIVYATIGTISLILGVMGIFLPVLPTTPFLLLTAALYFKASPKLYNWLMNHKCFGPYIRNFREHKAIPLRAKIVSVTMLWGTLLYCTIFVADIIWLRLFFIILAIAITIHILSFKTLKRGDLNEKK